METTVYEQHAGATILLVDDNPANLSLLVNHLLTEAYQITVAESGESALQRLAFRKPDLILLDVSMPGIDGYETCRRIKASAETADIPVIFLSAHGDVADKVEGFNAGGVDYVRKPIEIAEVMARVRTHLTLSSLAAELAEKNRLLNLQASDQMMALEEAAQRAQREAVEKDKLLDMLQAQNDQIRLVMQSFLQDATESQRSTRHEIVNFLHNTHKKLRQHLAQMDRLIYTPNSDALLRAELASAQTHLDELIEMLERTVPIDQASDADKGSVDPFQNLSNREREIFDYIVAGRSNREIAQIAHIAETTIRTYRRRIMRKLNVKSVPALIKLALENRHE